MIFKKFLQDILNVKQHVMLSQIKSFYDADAPSLIWTDLGMPKDVAAYIPYVPRQSWSVCANIVGPLSCWAANKRWALGWTSFALHKTTM